MMWDKLIVAVLVVMGLYALITTDRRIKWQREILIGVFFLLTLILIVRNIGPLWDYVFKL